MNIIYITLALMLAIVVVIITDYFLTKQPATGVIAGDVRRETVDLRDKSFYSFRGISVDRKSVKPKDFDFIGYLKGKSLTPFGLPAGTKVFCKKIGSEDIKRGDVLILKTIEGPNEGKPKGRICLGRWGNPGEPDNDLKKIENYSGTVAEYFKSVPYEGPIENYLKTLTFDQNGEKIKISRPHNPSLIIAKVDYVL